MSESGFFGTAATFWEAHNGGVEMGASLGDTLVENLKN